MSIEPPVGVSELEEWVRAFIHIGWPGAERRFTSIVANQTYEMPCADDRSEQSADCRCTRHGGCATIRNEVQQI